MCLLGIYLFDEYLFKSLDLLIIGLFGFFLLLSFENSFIIWIKEPYQVYDNLQVG